ncbi:MAG: polysaccharide deacetylase family protein, partial [Treponema sp.]|nr:polysaccharide deacetylase family protein [Treponema sp.]
AAGSGFRIPFLLENLTDRNFVYDELIWNPSEDSAGLLLSVDDDFWYTWRQYFDMFDVYGAKLTFFVQGAPDSLDKNMSLTEFCREAVKRGHDIGFHTTNHLNLPKVSRDTFNTETIYGAHVFRGAGISFSAFAFPYGLSEPWMRETLSPVFRITRGYGTNIRFYNSQTAKSGYIVSIAIDNIIYPDDQKFESVVFFLLFAAKFTGNSFIPLTTHDFSDTVQWGIKPGRMDYLLRTAQRLKLKFYTYADVQRLISE